MKKEISIGLCSVLATLIFLFPVQAQTDEKMGHPLINRSIHDTGSGGIFLFESSFTLENSTLINFSFYDDDFPGRQITPLIFESSSSDWKIVGVGTTRTTDGSGPQTYDFGLVSGSSATGPGKHFGWKHGDLTSRENGTPEFNSGAPGRFVWLGDPVAPIELNQELSPNVTLDRTYSIEAVASVQGSSPSAPSNVTGLAADASIQVSWTAPADNGGKTITSYTATASPGAANCASVGSPAGTLCTINSGLTNGIGYTISVTATNADGTSAPSAASSTVTPRPSVPVSVPTWSAWSLILLFSMLTLVAFLGTRERHV